MVSSRILVRVLQLQAGHKTQSSLANGSPPPGMLFQIHFYASAPLY